MLLLYFWLQASAKISVILIYTPSHFDSYVHSHSIAAPNSNAEVAAHIPDAVVYILDAVVHKQVARNRDL